MRVKRRGSEDDGMRATGPRASEKSKENCAIVVRREKNPARTCAVKDKQHAERNIYTEHYILFIVGR